MPMEGAFIVFEGVDGSGKSTVCRGSHPIGIEAEVISGGAHP